jgi:hypothetical protein
MSAIPTFPPIGMSPAVWGPVFWNTMHIASMGYSPKPSAAEQDAARAFYESLAHMIPCPICRSHYREFLQETPVAVESRDALIYWVFSIHNRVNERLGKRAVTFDEYIERMRRMSAGGGAGTGMGASGSGGILLLCVGVAAGLGLAYAYKQSK